MVHELLTGRRRLLRSWLLNADTISDLRGQFLTKTGTSTETNGYHIL